MLFCFNIQRLQFGLKKFVGGCGFCSSFLGICHIKILGFLELGCDP